MQIIKVTTYHRDNKGSKGDKQERFFADHAKALEFATSEGRTNGDIGGEYQLEDGHFWSDEVDASWLADIDATGETGDRVVRHALVSFHEVN
jgi:hypothetical protein